MNPKPVFRVRTTQLNSISKAWCIVFCISCAGCGAASSVSPIAATSSVDEARPQVSHPEYANWSRFPVGTRVVRKDVLASPAGDRFLYTTLRLAQKSNAMVILETQTAIEQAGERIESDINRVEYPAKFRLPSGMQSEQFDLPSLKAKLVGAESLQVGGREVETEVFQFEDTTEAGPVDVTLWRSSTIPGRQVKKEIVDRNRIVLSSSEILEIAEPEPKQPRAE